MNLLTILASSSVFVCAYLLGRAISQGDTWAKPAYFFSLIVPMIALSVGVFEPSNVIESIRDYVLVTLSLFGLMVAVVITNPGIKFFTSASPLDSYWLLLGIVISITGQFIPRGIFLILVSVYCGLSILTMHSYSKNRTEVDQATMWLPFSIAFLFLGIMKALVSSSLLEGLPFLGTGISVYIMYLWLNEKPHSVLLRELKETLQDLKGRLSPHVAGKHDSDSSAIMRIINSEIPTDIATLQQQIKKLFDFAAKNKLGISVPTGAQKKEMQSRFLRRPGVSAAQAEQMRERVRTQMPGRRRR